MNEENSLDQLNFESSNSSNEVEINVDTNSFQKDNSGKKFKIVLTFVTLVLLISISILGYYLFLNNSNQNLHVEVQKIDTQPKVEKKFNLKDLSVRKEYQIDIYYSSAKNELTLLGEGVLISNSVVLTSNDVIKNYKSEELVVKQNNIYLPVELVEGSATNQDLNSYWTLKLKGKFRGDFISFSNNRLEVGEELNLISTRSELILSNEPKTINVLQKFQIIGEVDDDYVYLSNLSTSDSVKVVFNNQGEAVGVTTFKDSKNNSVILSGRGINNILKSRGEDPKVSNKDKIGVIFEFSELDKFRKEGRPVGLVVKDVVKDGLADKSGIKIGDIILTMNNQIITSQLELDNFFINLSLNEEVKIELIRDDKKVGITLNLQ